MRRALSLLLLLAACGDPAPTILSLDPPPNARTLIFVQERRLGEASAFEVDAYDLESETLNFEDLGFIPEYEGEDVVRWTAIFDPTPIDLLRIRTGDLQSPEDGEVEATLGDILALGSPSIQSAEVRGSDVEAFETVATPGDRVDTVAIYRRSDCLRFERRNVEVPASNPVSLLVPLADGSVLFATEESSTFKQMFHLATDEVLREVGFAQARLPEFDVAQIGEDGRIWFLGRSGGVWSAGGVQTQTATASELVDIQIARAPDLSLEVPLDCDLGPEAPDQPRWIRGMDGLFRDGRIVELYGAGRGGELLVLDNDQWRCPVRVAVRDFGFRARVHRIGARRAAIISQSQDRVVFWDDGRVSEEVPEAGAPVGNVAQTEHFGLVATVGMGGLALRDDTGRWDVRRVGSIERGEIIQEIENPRVDESGLLIGGRFGFASEYWPYEGVESCAVFGQGKEALGSGDLRFMERLGDDRWVLAGTVPRSGDFDLTLSILSLPEP